MLWLLLCLGAVSDTMSNNCPDNVETMIQTCIEESGLYNIQHTVGTVFVDGRVQTKFCRSGISLAVTCVENILKFCDDDLEQRMLVQLLVDVHKLRTSFNYFCQNLHVFASNQSCVVGLYHIPTCMDAVTHKNKKHINTTLSGDLPIKALMDNLCGLFDVINTCYTISFPSNCYMTSQLFLHLFNGARYPYCDLPETEKRFKLLKILDYSSSTSSIFSFLYPVVLPVILLLIKVI